MSNRKVPQETYFPVSCLQEGRVCPNYILLSWKVKHFKNILTKLVTHKRNLESERRKALIIINQMDSTNFRTKLEKKPRWERLHVVEKLSPAKGHLEDPNPCITQKWTGEDDEVKMQVFLVLPMPLSILLCLKNILLVCRKFCWLIVLKSVQNFYL